MDTSFSAIFCDDCVLVEVAAGTIRRGNTRLALSRRERDIALAIATSSRPVSRLDLGRLLFPDRDEIAAGTVKVGVCRLRKRLDENVIVRRGDGYAVGPHVRVDAIEGRRALETLARSAERLASNEMHAVCEMARGLRCASPSELLDYEWYEPVSRSARRLGRDLALCVANRAFASGLFDDAVAVSRELTYEDFCDEAAWEVLVKSQLRLGERAAALQSFRWYETALDRELGTAPSIDFRRFVLDASNLCLAPESHARPCSNA